METVESAEDGPRGSTPIRAVLQVGVAGLGALILLWGLFGLVFVFGTMPRSESGFAEGLALILFGLFFLAGFVVLSLGLLVPQREDSGLQFNGRQRRLLGYGVVAPIVGLVAVPLTIQLAPASLDSIQMIVVGTLVGFALTGPLATLVVVGSKIRSWRQ